MGAAPAGMQTGLMQQLQARRLQNQRGIIAQGAGLSAVEGQMGMQTGRAAPGAQSISPGTGGGAGSLNNMAQQLARSYGLPIGSGSMVDEYGNITYQPKNEEEMMKLQMISDAIYNRQTQESHARGVAAQTAGMGLVRQRGRGSLAAMQSGMYENLASLYANQEFQQADYTLMIQSEQLQRAERIQQEARRQAKKAKKSGMVGGIIGGVVGFVIAGPAGAAVGYGIGSGAGSSGAF
jgi:hypothetical protein